MLVVVCSKILEPTTDTDDNSQAKRDFILNTKVLDDHNGSIRYVINSDESGKCPYDFKSGDE